ncbi:MAG: DoxX family protein [Geodermatophilaceae bacterium]|nr:DoxX family protein [Geodermatophilaceae bacterium]
MNVVLWVVAGLLAAAFLSSGAFKLSQPQDTLIAAGQGWVEGFPAGQVKAIGALEVLAAVGLILPALLDVAPILVPVAASGLVLLMIGALVTNARRNERSQMGLNVVLATMAVFVAWGRFGPYPF